MEWIPGKNNLIIIKSSNTGESRFGGRIRYGLVMKHLFTQTNTSEITGKWIMLEIKGANQK